jgi:copper chaperone NosL
MSTGLAPLVACAVAAAALTACSERGASPAALDVRNDACGHCRMTVSDPRFAAQVVSPGEEPRFFDDLGCLRAYLEAHPSLPQGSAAFVASYATRAWVPAHSALYVKHHAIQTPMGSHYVAYASASERDRGPGPAGGVTLSPAELFGGRLPGGAR